MTGKSTFGIGETGSRKNASPPASASPMVSSVVATGRWMKGVEILTRQILAPPGCGAPESASSWRGKRWRTRAASRSKNR